MLSFLSSCGAAAVLRESPVALPPMQTDARVNAMAEAPRFAAQVARAVTVHPSLIASAARIQLTYANADSVRADLLPSVSIGVDLIDSTTGRPSLTPAVRVAQLLFDGGATTARLRASRTDILRQY